MLSELLSEKLKEQTRKNHQDLEGILIPEIKAVNSQSDYLALLNLFYSYFGALEKKIIKVIDLTQLPDFESRRKASALAQDIQSLNGKLPEFAPDSALPDLQNHLQALGALYVIEGSTLGGKIISQMISRNLAGSADHALSFYTSYGEQMGEMWAIFKNYLDKQGGSESDDRSVIDAANETFLKLRELALKK